MTANDPKTTWEDLKNLGWPKQQVFDRLNALRGGTMESLDDMALNERFAVDFGWYCFNALHGGPRIGSQSSTQTDSSTVVASYANSGSEPYTIQWNQNVTITDSASLSISTHAGITLTQSITISGVAGSDFTISIPANSTQTETQTTSRQVSLSYSITVGPQETVILELIKTVTTGQATYLQDYGIANNSIIATKGREWNGHQYWGFNVNPVLNNPQGTMRLNGSSVGERYSLKVMRVSPDGTHRTESLPLPKEAIEALTTKTGDRPFPAMIAGPE